MELDPIVGCRVLDIVDAALFQPEAGCVVDPSMTPTGVTSVTAWNWPSSIFTQDILMKLRGQWRASASHIHEICRYIVASRQEAADCLRGSLKATTEANISFVRQMMV
jgi:hypothetical protein